MKKAPALAVLGLSILVLAHAARAQSLGNASTIEGTVTDPSGAVALWDTWPKARSTSATASLFAVLSCCPNRAAPRTRNDSATA